MGIEFGLYGKKPWRKAHNKVTRTFEVETGLEMTIGANKSKNHLEQTRWVRHQGRLPG